MVQFVKATKLPVYHPITTQCPIPIRSGIKTRSSTKSMSAPLPTAAKTAWGFSRPHGQIDYLQDLGVTAVWLPFFPSPWRDDG